MRCFPFVVYACVCLEVAQCEVVVIISFLGSKLLCYPCSNFVQLRGLSGSMPILFLVLWFCIFVNEKLYWSFEKNVVHQALEGRVQAFEGVVHWM